MNGKILSFIITLIILAGCASFPPITELTNEGAKVIVTQEVPYNCKFLGLVENSGIPPSPPPVSVETANTRKSIINELRNQAGIIARSANVSNPVLSIIKENVICSGAFNIPRDCSNKIPEYTFSIIQYKIQAQVLDCKR